MLDSTSPAPVRPPPLVAPDSFDHVESTVLISNIKKSDVMTNLTHAIWRKKPSTVLCHRQLDEGQTGRFLNRFEL